MKKSHLASALSLSLMLQLSADEGMWTFDRLPLKKISETYGTHLEKNWIDHVRSSCLRVSLGGSASFVSENGLILTNHHVGSKAIHDLSSEKQNLMDEGFYADSYDKELKCPNVYFDQLMAIKDVTEEVNKHLTDEMNCEKREEKRKEILSLLKEDLQNKSDFHVEVVTLYNGAKYHLYQYKRYTDIRLVMAPEKSIAFFGGDEENFEYPRHDLDFCFFRAYENDRPANIKHFLKWSENGPKENEALFVIGHPGNTKRIYTASHQEHLRDILLPLVLNFLAKRIDTLEEYSKQSSEHARQALQHIFSLRNARKVYLAKQRSLSASDTIATKKQAEHKLLDGLSPKAASAWQELEKALVNSKSYIDKFFYTERLGFRLSASYNWAKHLVRLSVEKQKPNEKRLPEYVDSEHETIKRKLFSKAPVYKELEKAVFLANLYDLVEVFGSDHPMIIDILDGKTPEVLADEIMDHTKLYDLSFRQSLFDNLDLVKDSNDPLICFVKSLDVYARNKRKTYEAQFESIQTDSYSEIANALFNEYGDQMYPDATFTLRLSYGQMKGYMDGSCFIKPVTYLEGLYEKHESHQGIPSYELPQKWLDAKSHLRNFPLNFVSTHDIIGGNSGSPVINQNAEIVGLIFDGNKDSLVWDIEFDETTGRAVSVHSSGILASLKDVYHADALVKELMH